LGNRHIFNPDNADCLRFGFNVCILAQEGESMTCIAGLIDNDKVYIGGDSAGISNYDLTIRNDPKVFKNGSFLFGFTSSFRMVQILRFKFKPPYHKPEINAEEFMTTEFIDAVRQCLKENGYAEINNNQETAGTFLVGYQNSLFIIDSDYQVGISHFNFAAVGCGAPYALGSLNSTSGNPEERIKKALETAERFSAGVRGPFKIEVI
jgi:ATP-dependent protease HslVU (ClpYQ) peptidase subunit